VHGVHYSPSVDFSLRRYRRLSAISRRFVI
jgi:hypothetical protein